MDSVNTFPRKSRGKVGLPTQDGTANAGSDYQSITDLTITEVRPDGTRVP